MTNVTEAWENIVKRLDNGIIISMSVAELKYLLNYEKQKNRKNG